MTIRHPFSAIKPSVPVKFLSFAAGALLLVSAGIATPVYAQSVTFDYVQITLPTTGLGGPWQAAKDASGNVYIADSFNARVVELPAGGGPQITVPLTGLSDPDAVAVDQNGNLFVGDLNGDVIELPAGGTQKTVASDLIGPADLAIDPAGNVLIADGVDGLFELPAGGGTLKNLVNGVGDIFGVAVDASDNIYMAVTTANTILELPSGKNSPITLPITGLSSPFGVMVDTKGNIFVADTGHLRLLEYPAGGGSLFTIGSGIKEARALSPDGAGGLLVTDTVNNEVWDFSPAPVNFASINVCPSGQSTPAPCSQSATLNFTVGSSPVTVNTVKVLTQGAPNLDFTKVSDTCTGSLGANAPCAVTVKFAPIAPGLRQGAVKLFDNSGNLLLTTLLRGVGEGPAVAFPGGAETTLFGISHPEGAGVDASGNLFLADQASSIQEFPPGCTPSSVPSCVVNWGGGFQCPSSPAVDGAGNVYDGDGCNQQAYVIPPGCSSSSCETNIGSGIGVPGSVALDGYGDVFIPDNYAGHPMWEVFANGTQTTVGSGLDGPFGAAVDTLGNVFVADPIFSYLVEIPSVGPQTSFGNLGCPVGVAVDAAGDVFALDGCGGATEFPTGCRNNSCSVSVSGDLNSPEGFALDAAGDLFIADQNNSRVQLVQRSQASPLNFPSTLAGTTSSPLTVTLQNIGNTALTFMNFAASTNFSVDSGSTTCSTSSPLAPGGLCNVGVAFAPMKDGLLMGSLTVTDNALNASSATQSVPLTGTGMGCSLDNDCASGYWCNETAKSCASQLPNSAMMPMDSAHTDPVLNGRCSAQAGALVCESGVCDTNNNECGYAVGDGPCTGLTSTVVCQSGACSVNNTCEPAGGCNVNGDCSTGYSCSAHACTINTYMVSPSVSGSGTISPSTVQTVDYGSTQAFTLTPNTGYHIGTIGGTCPSATLSSNLYTTGAVTANCTVIANFAINTYMVTPSVNNTHGTISPSTVQTVNYNSASTFTVAANLGYTVTGVGGTCGGMLSGNMYTTNPVTAACTVILNIGQAPAITSANKTTFQTGAAGSFPVTASGIPAVMSFTETGKLPSGVTLNPTSGALSGTPAAGTGGVYPITITASNGVLPNAMQSFTLSVDQAPAITSPNYATFTKGVTGSFTVTTTGYPVAALSYSPVVGSLPAGVTFHDNGNGTATISGKPAVSGVFPFWIETTNGVSPPGLESFSLTVKP